MYNAPSMQITSCNFTNIIVVKKNNGRKALLQACNFSSCHACTDPHSFVTHLRPRISYLPRLWSLLSPPLSALVYPDFRRCLLPLEAVVSLVLPFRSGSSIPRTTLLLDDDEPMQLSSLVLLFSCFFMFWEILWSFSLNFVKPFSMGSTAWLTVNFKSFTICTMKLTRFSKRIS